ncbi:MAG TPA: glycosyltransferase [Bryobacteraceae bacterium]|nr:glycosyltransferase [Bryobacteraceae bacterium]
MKIRVLEILATLRRAGAERVAVSLASGLDPERFETEVISLKPPFEGGFEPVLAERGIAVRHLGKRDGLDPRMWPRLARAMARFEPDIIHTHSYVMRYALPAWAARRQGRLAHTVHNVADREVEPLGRAVHRVAFRAGALAVAISHDVARSFERMYGFAPAATIPNGADTRHGYRPSARERWRRERGFGAGEFLVASVARFEKQKNPLGLMEAFARAFAGRADARLVMAGEGSLLEAARRRAEELGVARRVYFQGLCLDVPELLSACDLFVLGSDWEGSSVAVIEAMAAHLPVVATAVGGVPELVQQDATGLLVPAGHGEALASAMRDLAADGARLRAFGEAGARRAREFDTAAMVAGYAEFFERVVAGARGKRRTARGAAESAGGERVALLVTGLGAGGAESQVARLAMEMKRRGWQVQVISLLVAEGELAGALRAAGVPVVSLRMREGRADPRGLFRLASALKRWRPGVLHSHMFHANLLARAARLLCPVPVEISTLHSAVESRRADVRGRSRVRDAAYQWTDWLTDAVVAVSEAVAQRHISGGAAKAAKTRVIPNGVDTDEFRPDADRRARVRGELGLGAEFTWLAAGRLLWKKDFPAMLRALASLPGGRLLLAGEGPQEAELKALAGELGLASRVRFLGQVRDMAGVMAAADGFVMSSVVEGLPVSLLEAMASGLPAVATDVGGVAEAMGGRTSDEDDWACGFVVLPGDSAKLAQSMAAVMAMPGWERERMGRAARERAVTRFAFGAVASAWEKMYRELLERRRPWM